jgi:type IX secretion system PorP/SprF family membrane protein
MLTRFFYAALLFSCLFFEHTAKAQFIAYSQYNNVPLLTNPARASLSDYTQLTFHYRRSRVANYQIPSLSLVLPFFRQANGLRYAGVGANIISQQAGPGGLYKITGVTGTFAYTIHLSSTSHIAAGLGGGIINKRIDASAMTTDSQFNFGAYDPSLANGENFKFASVTQPVVNTGFCWVLTGTDNQEKASLGIAAYNINRPSFNILQDAAHEQATYVVTGALEIVKRERVSVSPTFRYINNRTSMANIGVQVKYTPGLNPDILSASVWYKTTGAMVTGLLYEHKAYVLAASMDFSTSQGWDAKINNAFELSLGWRLNKGKRTKPRQERVSTAVAAQPTPQAETAIPAVLPQPQETTTPPAQQPSEDKGTLLTKEEEQLSDVQIQFQLASEAVSAEHEAFLDQLVTALNNHPDYQLKITGHTCTVGDKITNEKVSYERAEAVARKLIAKGVPGDRLVTMGLDFQKPVASNDTEAGREQNRRVEFEWIKK